MSITTAAELWRMSATQLAEAIRSRQVSSQDVIGPVRGNIARIWSRAKKAVGDVVPPDLHFHDLRHAGNRFAASSGASTRELMGRLRQVGCCLAAGPRTARTRRGVDRPLARVAGGRTSAVGTSSLAKRFPTD